MVSIASLCSRAQTHGGSQFSLGSISNHLLSSRYFILSKSPSVKYYYVVHLPFFFSFCLILASHYLLYASIFTYYIMICCKFNYRYINRLCIVFIIHRFDSNPILSCTVTYGFCSTVQKRIRNLEYICSSTHVLIHMWHGHEQLLLHGFQNRCFQKLF